jgi:hypothetical protein
MNLPFDPPGPAGPKEPCHASPYITNNMPIGTTTQEEEAAPQLCLLHETFNRGMPPEDLPKGTLLLDKDNVDEEVMKTLVATILNYYQTITNLLEASVGTEHCALSNEAWLCLHNMLMAYMINGISHSFMANANNLLFSTHSCLRSESCFPTYKRMQRQ